MARILIVRGHLVNPWELGPWSELPEEFEVSYLLTESNQFALPGPRLEPVRVRALRDVLPGGRLGDLGVAVLGDRYLGVEEAFATADIVHAEELSFWFAAEAARRRARARFRLVQTVWETLPFLESFRNRLARRSRREVLEATDMFIPATRRAAQALLLEGVPDARIRVCPPGIDLGRFAATATSPAPSEHLILSPGRLVWEKGHQDVLRALAALIRGIVPVPEAARRSLRLLIVGSGPEERRLAAYARELGLGSRVEFRSLRYNDMPAAFAQASGMVLASLPWSGAAYHPFDVPRAFWEEQFGMVLAEAMAAGLDIIATTSGAIPEVLAGTQAQLVAPGDWIEIARRLAAGPLSRAPGERVGYPSALVERYSTKAAAARLADIYRSLLSTS
ncbi:MAG TPA: glycosyltransferase family 4 protein [Solirubrobacteraceae bacterium]|jgi:glycosyltransferase involved in cell wall biosynthesis|nr:glycosyltransferase family 4 protein [Solirubrobacteraceae bacterium]